MSLNSELLRSLLRYEPSTGKLFWRKRDGRGRGVAIFNARWAGKEAFTADNGSGYKQGCICSRVQKAHRIIWIIVYGETPSHIDHINGDRSDNRITNLRSVSPTDNARNKVRPRTNTSGIIGVWWRKDISKWQASIRVSGRRLHLGYFSDMNGAAGARHEAERAYGFHPNHGRTAK